MRGRFIMGFAVSALVLLVQAPLSAQSLSINDLIRQQLDRLGLIIAALIVLFFISLVVSMYVIRKKF